MNNHHLQLLLTYKEPGGDTDSEGKKLLKRLIWYEEEFISLELKGHCDPTQIQKHIKTQSQTGSLGFINF